MSVLDVARYVRRGLRYRSLKRWHRQSRLDLRKRAYVGRPRRLPLVDAIQFLL